MKMNLLTKRAAVLAAATILGSTLVIAADGGGAMGGLRERIRNRLVLLGVTGEQRDQIREVLRDHLPEVGPLVKQSIQEHRTLRDTIRATPVNEAAIRAQAAKVAAIDADLAVKRALIVEKVRPILTPDQIKRIVQAEEQRQSRVDEGLGRLGRWIQGE
jgi:Spy/CpxP family protein refolding chaperone